MLPLRFKEEWQLYNTCAMDSGLKGAEVVAECASLLDGEMTVHRTGMTIEEIIVDLIIVEVLSQEECQSVAHMISLESELVKTNSESLNLALVRDEFDANTFDENLNNEQNIDENDESSNSESDEENMQAPFDTTRDVSVATGGKGNKSNMPQSAATVCDVPTSNCIDWRVYYTEKELRALKSKRINLQEYPNHKVINHIRSAVCDSAVVNDEGNPKVRDEVI
jgi:hypothetical protein